jgi:hypothetical protein
MLEYNDHPRLCANRCIPFNDGKQITQTICHWSLSISSNVNEYRIDPWNSIMCLCCCDETWMTVVCNTHCIVSYWFRCIFVTMVVSRHNAKLTTSYFDRWERELWRSLTDVSIFFHSTEKFSLTSIPLLYLSHSFIDLRVYFYSFLQLAKAFLCSYEFQVEAYSTAEKCVCCSVSSQSEHNVFSTFALSLSLSLFTYSHFKLRLKKSTWRVRGRENEIPLVLWWSLGQCCLLTTDEL